MNIKEWITAVHKNAVDKGFWDSYKGSPTLVLNNDQKLSKLMLIVSEVAEACEEIRNGSPPEYQAGGVVQGDSLWKEGLKTEGEAVELADAVIRIFDYAGAMGWDLEAIMERKHSYNVTRPYKHGKLL